MPLCHCVWIELLNDFPKETETRKPGLARVRNQKPKRKPAKWNGRIGAVGVIVEDSKFLVIKRSPMVRAPNLFCFPGGSVESGETAEQAVIREMMEELKIEAGIVKHLWSSQTDWGTKLEWFQIFRLNLEAEMAPDPFEVAEIHWMTEAEILACPALLGSMPSFFQAKDRGDLVLN